jgi:Ca2+-binding RTX toxin-like protein
MPRSNPTEDQGGDHFGDGPGGWRTDPPGQEDNEHSQRPEFPPGLLGETLTGTDGDDELHGGAGDDSVSGGLLDDSLRGQHGDDTLDGGAGDDTLAGGPGADLLIGGDGNDTFVISGPAKTLAGLDQVVGFQHGQDQLVFDDGAVATDANFATATATDYADAVDQAQALIAGGDAYVAVQLGTDVVVFAADDDEPGIGGAVVLVGRTLADVSAGDFG